MNKSQPLSVADIHNVFTNYSEDITNSVLHIDAIPSFNYDLKKIFGERYSIIFFIPNPDKTNPVGHFILLSWLEDKLIEYFDSFANEPHPFVLELMEKNDLIIRVSKIQLQNNRSNICAKWCILRLKSIPTHLGQFQEIFTQNKKLSPDEIVDSLVQSLYKK
jgi:hypothetical protein